MNHVLKRTLTGLTVGGGVVALFLWCPLQAVSGIVIALSCLAQLEFYQMAKRYEPVAWFGLLSGVAWICFAAFGQTTGFAREYVPVACALAFFALCAWVLFRQRYKHPAGTIASTLLGFLYVPFLFSFFIRIIGLGSSPSAPRAGLYTLLALIAMAKFSDTGGFALGLAFGKHKMCPAVSPKKSWEGLAGSVLFASVTACVFLAISRYYGWGSAVGAWNALTYPVAVAIGAAVAVLATIGDLVESRFKREFEVKDSATFMPAGMGGFLDMFDSFLFIPALAYLPLLYANTL